MTALHFVCWVLAAYFALAWILSVRRRWQWVALGNVRYVLTAPPVRGWHVVAAICFAGMAVLS